MRSRQTPKRILVLYPSGHVWERAGPRGPVWLGNEGSDDIIPTEGGVLRHENKDYCACRESGNVRLAGTTGSEFALKIEGYEFPARGKDRYDDNWLEISIEVKSPQGGWNARGPYLLQWEAEQLATWLEGISKEAPLPGNSSFTDDLSFMEPNLWFVLRRRPGESSMLRIHFGIEFRPPWADKYHGESYVDLTLSVDDLLNAARA